MAIDKKKLKNLDLWGKDDTTVTTTTGKTYKMSQVGTKNYTVNQQKAAENKAAMAKAEQVHKQAQAKAQQQQKAQQKAQIKTTAADRVKKSLLSMPEMTDYTRESVQPDKYDTTPGTLPKIKNVLRRADNAGASILAKQLGSKEVAIKTAAIGVKSKATSLLGGNESDRYKRQMSALSSKYGVRATTMPEYKLAQLNYNNALAKEKIKSRQAILKATKSADDYKKFRNAALDGLTGGKRTAANFLMGAGDMGADIALLGATGAVGGATAMGLGAMGDKARQVALKGGTTDDALKAGLLSGGVSAAVNYAVPKALGKVGALAPKALPTYRNSILAGEDLIRSGNSGYISGLKGLNSELAKTVLSNAAKEGVHGSAFGVANTLGQGAANALLGEQTGITPGSLAREAGTGFIMGAGMGGIRGGIGAYGASRGNKAYAEGFADEYNKHYDELRGDLRKGLLDRQVQQTPLMLGTTKGTLGEKIVNDAKNTPLALPKGADFTVDSEGNITKFQNPTEPTKAYNDDKITKYEEKNSKTVPSIDNVKYEESSNPYEDFSRYLEAAEGTYSEDDIAKVKSMWADIDKNYNGNPSAYAIDIADKFEKLYKEEVNYLANKFYKYKPKGVDIIRIPSDSRSAILGTIPRRISNNDKWYSDAYKKYGHTPTKSDRLDYAKNLIESDLNDGKSVYASPELRELHNKFNDIIKYGRTLDGKYGSFQEATKDANNDYVLHFGTKYEGLPEPTANEPYPVYDGKQSLVGGKTLGGKINKAWAEKNTTPGELPTETTPRAENITVKPVNNKVDVTSETTLGKKATGTKQRNTTPGELPTYGKGTVGAAEVNPNSINSQMEELSAKYGSMPYGEEPRARVDNIPKSTDGKTKVSQFARNMIEAEVTPEPFVQELEKSIIKGEFSHKIVTDRKSLEKAEEIVSGGYEKALDYWNTKIDTGARLDKTDMAVAMELYNQAANVGDVQTAMKLAGDMASIETLSGQIVQAARMLKKMTPDANLYSLEQTINRLNKNAPKGREIKLNEELAKNLLKSKSADEMTKNVKAIRKDISSQMDASIFDTINEWRYFAMLANPRTHIRNIVGNVTTNMLYRTKDVVGTALEKGVNTAAKQMGYEGVDKTKSIMSPLKSEADKKLISYAKENYENNMKGVATGESKVHDSQTELYRDRNVFAQNPIGRALSKITGGKSNTLANLLDKATKGNTRLLEVEDNIAIKNKYVDSFAKYMKANKHTPEYYNSFEGQQALSKAQDYALQQALESTFHDDSKIADALIKFQKTNKLTDITIGTLFPFKKTPINVAKRGVEFSPIGLAKGTYDFGKSIKAAKQTRNLGNSEISKAIDELAKGLTGSGLMALGIALAYKGYINSGLSDNDKVSSLEKAEGKQKFALNLLDGTTVTLDSFSPTVIPVLAGAGLYEEYKKGGTMNVGNVVDMISALDSPLIEMSFLSSVNDAITDLKYGGDDPVPTIASSVVKNYAGSMMPTLLSAIGNTVDDTKRSSSYIDKNSKYGKTVQGIMNQATYKNPVTHNKLPPSLDVWGRETKTKSLGMRAFNNFLNPTSIKKQNITAPDKEVTRLYKSLGDSSVLPGLPDKSVEYKNNQDKAVTKNFTANEYTKFVQDRNLQTYNDINSIIKEDMYKDLSDEDKAEVISSAFTYNTEKARENAIKDYVPKKILGDIDSLTKTGMSTANAILFRQTLNNIEGEGSSKKKDELILNSNIPTNQKEALGEMVHPNSKTIYDYSNKTNYEISTMSDAKKNHYEKAKKQLGLTVETYNKAYDIVGKQQKGYKKESKIADLQKQLGMSYDEAVNMWNILKKK